MNICNDVNKEKPEPLGYVHHEMFAGFVKEPGDASMSCVKLHSPYRGYTVPVYAEPTARKPLSEERIHRINIETPQSPGCVDFARAIEAAHGIKGRE